LQGNPKLQLKLASMFMHGNSGVAVDAERAIYWYTIAAEQDIAYAQHKLAQIYLRQERINQNLDKALYWLRRAAKLGFVSAQLDLSRLYARGDRVPQDLVSAYMWLGIAESLAELDIEARQAELADRMSYLQLARAKFLTRKCILQQYRDC
jgi:TPR repeat protein